MHNFDFFGGGMMIFWWVLIILLIALFIKMLMNNRPSNNEKNQESPLDILKRRYANGEIDKEEFEEKKKDLLS